MLAALGAACAGCSAPSINTALAADNPANPDAASAPFVRPVDVLAEGAAPQTSIPSTEMHMAGGSMPAMDMSGGMAGMGHSSVAGMSPPSPGNDAAMPGSAASQSGMPRVDHGAMPGMKMPGDPQ
jgi:hypothetical protein